jgi:hypothetical protein
LNPYQHIRFEWGGRGPDRYDCIGLADLIRRRLNKTPIDFTKLEWVYIKHPTLEESPLYLVHQIAQVLGHPTDTPEDLSIAILENMDGRSNVGTVVGESIVAFMGDRVAVVPIDRLIAKMNKVTFFTIDRSLLLSDSIHLQE